MKRTGEKYQSILGAAVKVIAESGYYNAQVSRIAKEAGVADGTIYLYFKNKEDVLISIFRNKMGEFASLTIKEMTNIKDPFEMLARLVYLHFSLLQADRNLASLLQIQLRQSDNSIRQEISKIIRDYYSSIESIVGYGIEEGSFSRDLNPRVARKVIFGSLDEVATCWVLSSRRYNLVDMTIPVYNILARGLAGKAGEKPFPKGILPLVDA